MNRWEALVAIVKSFNDKDRPGYALAAVLVLVASALGVVWIATSGAMSLGQVIKLLG